MPIVPITIVSRSPIVLPSAPPRMLPIGIVPQTMKRIEAFIRPCIPVAVIACRKLTWLML